VAGGGGGDAAGQLLCGEARDCPVPDTVSSNTLQPSPTNPPEDRHGPLSPGGSCSPWKSHGITEWQGLQGTSGDHLIQHPAKQGHLQQAAQQLIQAGFKYLQRSRLHNLPGQPVPVLRHPQSSDGTSCASICDRFLLSCRWAPLKRV